MNTNTINTPTNSQWIREQLTARGLAPSVYEALPEKQQTEVDKRATRYGLLPVWPQNVQSRDYSDWVIPENTIRAYRYFLSETGRDLDNNITYETFRGGMDQITDLQRAFPLFIYLDQMASLSEDAAARVAEALTPQSKCPKYTMDLGYTCSTCFYNFLEHDAPARIEDLLENDQEKEVAYATARQLIAGMHTALQEARRKVDEAIRVCDDPKGYKNTLDINDLFMMRHLHQDMPKYKSVEDKESRLTDTITEAFAKLAQVLAPNHVQTTPQLPTDTAALKAQLAEIQKRLEEAEQAGQRESRIIHVHELSEDEQRRRQNLANLAKAREAKKASREAIESVDSTESVEAVD